MSKEKEQKETLKRYVLGELTESQAAQVEELYCADDNWLQALIGVRDDLLDEWARGDLNASEQQKLVQQLHRLPALRERAHFALDWQAATNERIQTDKITATQVLPRFAWLSRWPLAWGTVVVVILLIGVFFFWRQLSGKQSESQVVVVPSPTISATDDPEKLVSPTPQPPEKNPQSQGAGNRSKVTLFIPALIRGESETAQPLTVTKWTAADGPLHLEIETVQPLIRSAQVVLQNAEGVKLWQSPDWQLRSKSGVYYFQGELPATKLAKGTFRIELRSADDQLIAQHTFQIK